ncbi:hypothetical protein BO70DRAFT_428393 [Aspergillus heteromorphus CBS 117.55]|uniref:CBM-cenC domain-containing protein n=1 Tax=Aspergillus heteromorphus CBS 117.55 TaxID=1448321 RepID=A0A317WHY9_9EURO|nr:uncharacterized protein BO70DRAFT_428393 [Aspergillus heteromorphus CBS 117.55]PWY84787.1 hypothetical protein BO70DRAFT_428393 [Aspergillus heteromorphus CBS 117.55]
MPGSAGIYWQYELLTNPSFDTGSLSPWAVLSGYGSATVVEDTADDRGYVALLGDTSTLTAVYQTVTDLVVGDSYTLSFDYSIESAARAGEAAFYLCVDGIASANRLKNKAVPYTTTGTSWQTLSVTFDASSTTHEFYILVYVVTSSTEPQVYLDNAQFLAVSAKDDLQVCITSTYTSTSTLFIATSSSAAASSSTPVLESPSSVPGITSSVIIATSASPSSVSSSNAVTFVSSSSSPVPPRSSSAPVFASSHSCIPLVILQNPRYSHQHPSPVKLAGDDVQFQGLYVKIPDTITISILFCGYSKLANWLHFAFRQPTSSIIFIDTILQPSLRGFIINSHQNVIESILALICQSTIVREHPNSHVQRFSLALKPAYR